MNTPRAKFEIEQFEKAIGRNAENRILELAAYLIAGDHELDQLTTVDLCWGLGFASRRIRELEIDKFEEG